jgi:hypothetical protein
MADNDKSKKIHNASELIKSIKNKTKIVQVPSDKGIFYVPVYYNCNAHKKYFEIYNKFKDYRKAFCGLVFSMIKVNMAQVEQKINNVEIKDVENFNDKDLIKILELVVKQSKTLTEYYNKNVIDNHFERFYNAIEYERNKCLKKCEDIANRFLDFRNTIQSIPKSFIDNLVQVNKLFQFNYDNWCKIIPKFNVDDFRINGGISDVISSNNLFCTQLIWKANNVAETLAPIIDTKIQIEEMLQPLTGMSKIISDSVVSQFKTSFKPIWNFQRLAEDMVLTDEDIESLNNYRPTTEEISETQNIIKDVFSENDTVVEKKNTQQKIDAKWKIFSNKNPLIAKFIMIIITIIITNLVNLAITNRNNFVKGITNIIRITSDKKNINNGELKVIKKDVAFKIKNEFHENEKIVFRTYRYIVSDKAYVRVRKSMKSYCIKKLYKGNVVEIIKKNNHWSYVEYIDEDNNDNIVKGWVNNIYTRRFD